MRAHTHWRWHLDEVYVKINGEMRYLGRAVDHEGEVLESFVTKTRDKAAALKFIKKAMKRHGRPQVIVTDGLHSYGAAMKEIGNADRQEVGRWLNNRAENSHQPFRRRERTMERFRRMKTLQKFSSVMPRSTTIFLRSATSSAGRSTANDAPQPWRSGGPLRPEACTPPCPRLVCRRRVALGLTPPPVSPLSSCRAPGLDLCPEVRGLSRQLPSFGLQTREFSVPRTRRSVYGAQHLRGPSMNPDFSPADQAFRAEARSWPPDTSSSSDRHHGRCAWRSSR